MDIITVSIDPSYCILIKLNWLAIIPLILLVTIICLLTRSFSFFSKRKTIKIQEIALGIGNNSIKLHYDNKDQTIAYKLWVELNTRKIGSEFDQSNDVIVEIYNSWYEYFQISRELIKDFPIEKIDGASELVELAIKVLNHGLRPHLTRWQARYRKWYEVAIQESDSKLSPQDIQKEYPFYDELISDLIETNKRIIAYKNIMYKIAFNKEHLHN